MLRKITAVALVVALAGLISSPVQAKKNKKKPSGSAPIELTYYMNWFGDCAGSGYLALESTPNDASCALFFPGLGDTYAFGGAVEGPFTLDATKPITVDFVLSQVVSAAAEFEVDLRGTIKGESTDIASATQAITAATSLESTPLHYELQPEASLQGANVSDLTLTISWTSGATYSQMIFDSGTTMVVPGFKG